jgi:hypothetical protein
VRYPDIECAGHFPLDRALLGNPGHQCAFAGITLLVLLLFDTSRKSGIGQTELAFPAFAEMTGEE